MVVGENPEPLVNISTYSTNFVNWCSSSKYGMIGLDQSPFICYMPIIIIFISIIYIIQQLYQWETLVGSLKTIGCHKNNLHKIQSKSRW